MPYIIETKPSPARRREITAMKHAGKDGYLAAVHEAYARTAVATLDEARGTVRSTMDAALNGQPPTQNEYEWSRPLPESGGTIGPLPDGTVIEVRQVPMVGEFLAIDLTANNAHMYDKPVDFGWGVCRHGHGLQSFGDGYMSERVARDRAAALNAGQSAADIPNN